MTLGAYAQGRGSAIIRRLQQAGGLPLLLPPSPAPTAGEASDLLADEGFFRETFDRCLWPLFCQLLAGQSRGLSLIEGSQRVKDTNGTRSTEPLDLVSSSTSGAWSAMMQRYLSLLAWLVGMLAIGAGGAVAHWLSKKNSAYLPAGSEIIFELSRPMTVTAQETGSQHGAL